MRPPGSRFTILKAHRPPPLPIGAELCTSSRFQNDSLGTSYKVALSISALLEPTNRPPPWAPATFCETLAERMETDESPDTANPPPLPLTAVLRRTVKTRTSFPKSASTLPSKRATAPPCWPAVLLCKSMTPAPRLTVDVEAQMPPPAASAERASLLLMLTRPSMSKELDVPRLSPPPLPPALLCDTEAPSLRVTDEANSDSTPPPLCKAKFRLILLLDMVRCDSAIKSPPPQARSDSGTKNPVPRGSQAPPTTPPAELPLTELSL